MTLCRLRRKWSASFLFHTLMLTQEAQIDCVAGHFGAPWWTLCSNLHLQPFYVRSVWAWLTLTLVISHKSHLEAELLNASVKPLCLSRLSICNSSDPLMCLAVDVCIFYPPGSVAEHSTASSCSTWRNIVQRCACALKIPTAIAITAASSRANPSATPSRCHTPRAQVDLCGEQPGRLVFLFRNVLLLTYFFVEIPYCPAHFLLQVLD